jgi:hypothetical protein
MKLGAMTMNKSRFFQVLALSVVTTLVANSEEGVLTKAMQTGPSGKTTPKPVTKNEEFLGNKVSEPSRGIEFRVGPIMNTENNFKVQTGRRGQGFGLDNLDLSDVSYGVKADLDWDLNRGFHFNNGLTWIHFDQTGQTKSDITYGSGTKLLKGSHVQADLDIIKYEPKFGYDVVKNDSFRWMPYLGAIAVIADGKVAAVGGSVEREQGKISAIDREKAYNKTECFGTYTVGFETQFHFTRSFYAGLDLGGYYLDFVNGAAGKGYLAYDINERILLRLGCDVDWATFDDRNVKVEGYTTTPYVQLGVKF